MTIRDPQIFDTMREVTLEMMEHDTNKSTARKVFQNGQAKGGPYVLAFDLQGARKLFKFFWHPLTKEQASHKLLEELKEEGRLDDLINSG